MRSQPFNHSIGIFGKQIHKTGRCREVSVLLILLVAWFCGLGWIGSAHAVPIPDVIITVTTTVDDLTNNGNCTLREAIQAANTNGVVDQCPTGTLGLDQIRLPAGVYTISLTGLDDTNATGDFDINGDLDIVGAGAATTTIDGAAGGDRVFHVLAGTVSFDGVTIQNGSAAPGTSGGGILNNGALTVTNSTISGNSASFGGGIWTDLGTLTVTNSTISGNSAGGGGGGIWNHGALTVTNSTISGNSAINGGGILNSGTLTVTNSTISGNSAASDAGGIFNGGTLTMTNSTISGNSAANDGGGIWNHGALTVTNSTISGNSASKNGGGILNTAPLLIAMTNSTISRNSAIAGGGIWSRPRPVALNHTIIANQVAGGDCSPVSTDNGWNLDSDGTCGLSTVKNSQPGVNPQLGPLANNGGPTFTHALLPGSPAIDAGDPASVLATDQRGFTRPVDGDGNGTTMVDIGAFELGLLPVVGLNTNTSAYVTGNTMTLTASTTPGAAPINADVYVALQLPDGTLLVMQSDGSFSTALTPLVANISVPNFNGVIFNYAFSGVEPTGNYTWFAALTQPGTLNVIGTLAVEPFSFAP